MRQDNDDTKRTQTDTRREGKGETERRQRRGSQPGMRTRESSADERANTTRPHSHTYTHTAPPTTAAGQATATREQRQRTSPGDAHPAARTKQRQHGGKPSPTRALAPPIPGPQGHAQKLGPTPEQGRKRVHCQHGASLQPSCGAPATRSAGVNSGAAPPGRSFGGPANSCSGLW